MRVRRVDIVAAVLGLVIGVDSTAMEGVFDRTPEVEKYLSVVKSGTRSTLTTTAREISESGISDARLTSALQAKLVEDLPGLSLTSKVDTQYRIWMAIALAASGSKDAEPTIKQACQGMKSKTGKLNRCEQEIDRLEWYRARNEVMASRKYHNEGDDPQISRLLNLLMSYDFSMKYEAVEVINWNKLLHPRLLDAMEPQILQYMDSTSHGATRAQVSTVGYYVKFLGLSENPKYRGTLEQVRASKAGVGIKRHAGTALRRLSE